MLLISRLDVSLYQAWRECIIINFGCCYTHSFSENNQCFSPKHLFRYTGNASWEFSRSKIMKGIPSLSQKEFNLFLWYLPFRLSRTHTIWTAGISGFLSRNLRSLQCTWSCDGINGIDNDSVVSTSLRESPREGVNWGNVFPLWFFGSLLVETLKWTLLRFAPAAPQKKKQLARRSRLQNITSTDMWNTSNRGKTKTIANCSEEPSPLKRVSYQLVESIGLYSLMFKFWLFCKYLPAKSNNKVLK